MTTGRYQNDDDGPIWFIPSSAYFTLNVLLISKNIVVQVFTNLESKTWYISRQLVFSSHLHRWGEILHILWYLHTFNAVSLLYLRLLLHGVHHLYCHLRFGFRIHNHTNRLVTPRLPTSTRTTENSNCLLSMESVRDKTGSTKIITMNVPLIAWTMLQLILLRLLTTRRLIRRTQLAPTTWTLPRNLSQWWWQVKVKTTYRYNAFDIWSLTKYYFLFTY